MGQQSSIEWTDHTFNPWWGCTKVSPGCTHCYAETWSNRYGHDIWGPQKERRTFGEKHWAEPLRWNQVATECERRARVFCASMADIFEDNVSVEIERERLWSLIGKTPMLDWLLLTKRPENMIHFVPWETKWPNNVWAMTSVENQEQATIRIPLLSNVPAVARGLSIEPLLSEVDLGPWLDNIDWIIVGGESGRNARPLNPAWVVKIRNQCIKANIPFFFKQWGEWAPILPETETYCDMDDQTWRQKLQRLGKKSAGRLLDGKVWNEVPTIAII